MSKKEKLLTKLMDNSQSMTFDEAETLLGFFDFYKDNKGKTSGSRVVFVNRNTNTKILLHRPHPRKELLSYQKKLLKDFILQEGAL